MNKNACVGTSTSECVLCGGQSKKYEKLNNTDDANESNIFLSFCQMIIDMISRKIDLVSGTS